MSCPLDIDRESIRTAAKTGAMIVYEDHHIRTGLGSLLGTYLAEAGISCRFQRMGVTRYGGSGTPDDLYRSQELDCDSLVYRMQLLLEEKE
jgi:transketolase